MKRTSEDGLDHLKPLAPQWLSALCSGRTLPLEGVFHAADLPRLSRLVIALAGSVRWSLWGAPGESAARPGHDRWWFSVEAQVQMTCERCLEPMTAELASTRAFEFVSSVDEADQLTEEWLEQETLRPELAQIDLLAPQDEIGLRDLIEDELLLCLPPSPKHEACKPPRPLSEAADGRPEDRIHPFKGLDQLLKPKN